MTWYRSHWFGWVSVGVLLLADLVVGLPVLALEAMATDACGSTGPQAPICSGGVQTLVYLGPLAVAAAALMLAVTMALLRGPRCWLGHLAAWLLTLAGFAGGLVVTGLAVG